MQNSKLKLHFDEDKDQKVVFDQPYYYYMPPEGGKYDKNNFYRFQDGSYLTNDGYFFNNLGYDRYGGQLDKNFNYAIKDSSLITQEERIQLKAYPFWESYTNAEDYQAEAVQDEDKYQEADLNYKEDYIQYNQFDDYQDGDGGDDIFYKRQPANVKYQLKGAKGPAKTKSKQYKQQINAQISKKTPKPSMNQKKSQNKTISQSKGEKKPKETKNKNFKDDKDVNWDEDF